MPLHLGSKCTTIVYYPVCLPSHSSHPNMV